MPIQQLSEQLASQIAAGEVVERPSSVVKELVENAIDAGATVINIEVQEGGREFIQVADNGAGIPAAEAATAFLRHATSKLSRVEDLNAIQTLGFRGEALAAIAAVSQVTLTSRSPDEEAGIRLSLDGGHVTSRTSVGAPQGTVIAVANLFYNVPARLKFLKTAVTEKRLIDEFVTRYALAYPGIRFRLSHNGRITFHTNGSGQVLDVLVAVYGLEVARELLPLEGEREPHANGIVVEGYVGPPSLHWSNRSNLTLFINGRWVRDNNLSYAIIQAYHTLLPVGRYPFALLFITLPPEEVDVNVHPTKSEVRFHNPGGMFGAVQRSVRQILTADSPIRPVGGLGAWNPTPGWSGSLDDHATIRHAEHWADDDDHASPTPAGLPQTEMGLTWPAPAAMPEPSPLHPLPAPSMNLGGQRLPIMRVVGQVGAAYIIAEGPDGIFMIDQHAAHERILYEQFMAQQQHQGVAVQGLVTGTAVHLPPSQATLLEENLPVLAHLGFQIEPFGPQAFMVRALPALLARQDPQQAVTAVVEELERGDAPLQAEKEAKLVRRVCKSAAIKAGQTLAMPEMEALIRQLEACQSPHTCPHGRPTLIHLSVTQLAREFGRT